MKILKTSLLLSLSFSFVTYEAIAMDEDPPQRAHTALVNIVEDNNKYYSSHPEAGELKQTPRSTVVLCSDSRCQTQAFDLTPVNDIFEIRNIGNQFLTSVGSVKYGVEHLDPPSSLLIFVGHSRCGAITAATEGKDLPPDVLTELRTLIVKKGDDLNQGILENVHDQVNQSINTLKELVNQKKLIIAGAVFDFANDFGKGNNRLIFINVNGEKRPEQIKEMDIFKNIPNPTIGVGAVAKSVIQKKITKEKN